MAGNSYSYDDDRPAIRTISAKNIVRDELNKQVQEFLAAGKQPQLIPPGVSSDAVKTPRYN